MPFLKNLLLRLHGLIQRYPWVMPVYGFISGLAGFEGPSGGRWIHGIGYGWSSGVPRPTCRQ